MFTNNFIYQIRDFLKKKQYVRFGILAPYFIMGCCLRDSFIYFSYFNPFMGDKKNDAKLHPRIWICLAIFGHYGFY